MTATTQSQIHTSHSDSTIYRKSPLLRNALRGNGLFSLIGGVTFFLAAQPIADFSGLAGAEIIAGIDGTGFIRLLGVGLLPWAMALFWLASRPVIKNGLAWEVIGGDMLWVAGSALLLMTQALPLNTTGSWMVLILADVVLMFAVVQYVGIRQNVHNLLND
ncbi:MAG: hypothetical protein ACPG7F_06825 [Aggregatilineales bacterium]